MAAMAAGAVVGPSARRGTEPSAAGVSAADPLSPVSGAPPMQTAFGHAP